MAQVSLQADPGNAAQVAMLFGIARALQKDGYGVTLKVNPYHALITTNAPMDTVSVYADVATV